MRPKLSLVLLASSLLLASCGQPGTSTGNAEPDQKPTTQVTVVDTAKAEPTEAETGEETEQKQLAEPGEETEMKQLEVSGCRSRNKNGTENSNLDTVFEATPKLAEPIKTLPELMAASEAVVIGKVVDTADFCGKKDTLPNRVLTIKTTAILKSTRATQIPEQFSVSEIGAFVPHHCVPEAKAKDGFVDYQIKGHPHTEKEAQVLVFLTKKSADDNEKADFGLLHGIQGLFVKTGDDYLRSYYDNPEAKKLGIQSRISGKDIEEMSQKPKG